MTSPPVGPLTFVLSCPKCGAPVEADDETASLTCRHCRSLLVLSAPGRAEAYVTDGLLRDAADVAEMVVDYRLRAARAETVGRLRDAEGNAPPEAWIEAWLRSFEQELRRALKVTESRRFFAPYWHLGGRIVQGILGRFRGGAKVVRIRAFAVEHTVPAYDTRRANLRDRGLRLSRARVRPLAVRGVREGGAFLPWRPVAAETHREIEKWKGQDLDLELERITKQGVYVSARRVLVYRPYWVARVESDQGTRWLLADGQFRTVAGYPTEAEVRTLLEMAQADPLESESESYRRVDVTASRCPDCGLEVQLDRSDHVHVCSNCHLALEPTPSGLRVLACAHARVDEGRLDGDYLPFWRYEFEARVGGGPPFRKLEDYARAFAPAAATSPLAAKGGHLWVPAFRLLGTECGDDAFKELVEWIHARSPEVTDAKVPLGGRPAFWGATLPEVEARELLPFALFALHGKASAARLNTRLVKTLVLEAKLEVRRARLVLVPFDRPESVRDSACLRAPGGGPSVPLLLLRGGPELEAQKVSVQRAKDAEPEGFPPLSY